MYQESQVLLALTVDWILGDVDWCVCLFIDHYPISCFSFWVKYNIKLVISDTLKTALLLKLHKCTAKHSLQDA